MLGAVATPNNPRGCDPGRKAGKPRPAFYPGIRPLIEENLSFFPPGVDVPFLAAWIERESDGRHNLSSSLGEVGFFQLHPAEIEDMVGRSQRDRVIALIKSSPTESMQFGGRLLMRYDEAITRFGIPRRGILYHGLLKTMHSSRPRGIRWLREVKAALGRNPATFEEFLATTVALKARNSRLPRLPTCSAFQLLQRRDVFQLPGDGGLEAGSTRIVGTANQAVINAYMAQRNMALAGAGLGADPFPGLLFSSPIADAFVTSGWGRPRPARNGVHEGLDIRATVGTPVFAVEAGVVGKIATGASAGLFMTVAHGFGFTSRYMHLSETLVPAGARVRKGQLIALSGATGIKRSAAHLHFDMMLRPELIPQYIAVFGAPRTGFGRTRTEGTAVPSEPLIPVAGYAPGVIADANRNQIPLFITPSRPFPFGKAVAGVGALALLLVLGIRYKDPIRDRLGF